MWHYLFEMKDHLYGEREWGLTEIRICWWGSLGRKRLGKKKNAKMLVFERERGELTGGWTGWKPRQILSYTLPPGKRETEGGKMRSLNERIVETGGDWSLWIWDHQDLQTCKTSDKLGMLPIKATALFLLYYWKLLFQRTLGYQVPFNSISLFLYYPHHVTAWWAALSSTELPWVVVPPTQGKSQGRSDRKQD